MSEAASDTAASPTGMAGSPAGAEGAPTGTAGPTSDTAGPPSEEDLRAAYEAELSRISSADLVLQTAASLLNLGARRLGLTGAPEAERDLEQVRDAIDGVRGLMPVLERRAPGETGPLRDALSQLQMAYAREASAPKPEQKPAGEAAGAAGAPPQPGADAPQPGAGAPPSGQSRRPGPAEASGRLWVPGR
jgi:hypothetical protein